MLPNPKLHGPQVSFLRISQFEPHPINDLENCRHCLHNILTDVLPAKLLLDLIRMPTNSLRFQNLSQPGFCRLASRGSVEEELFNFFQLDVFPPSTLNGPWYRCNGNFDASLSESLPLLVVGVPFLCPRLPSL